jgi:hypothetical protein
MADDENKPKGLTAQDVANMQAAAEAANKQAVAIGEINEGMEAQVQLASTLAKSADDQLKSILEAKTAGQERLKQIYEEQQKLNEMVFAEGTSNEEKAKARHAAAIALKEEATEIQALASTNDEVVQQLRDMRDGAQAVAEKFGEIVSAGQNLDKTIGNAAEALTGIGGSWRRSVWGSTLSAAQSGTWADAISDVGKGLKDTFTPMNIAGSLMAGIAQQTMKMVWAIDSAQSNFRKTTGAGAAYDDVISDIYKDNKLAGVSFDDAAQAVQGLMGSMAGFGKMGKAARAEWAGMAATMNEIGVSVGDSGAFFTNATKVMGMNQAQTKELAGEMGGLAKELGTSLGPLMSEFNASMSDLAVYGDDAVGIFKRLKGASDVLGISVGNLVGSMKEMDTIEGAATRAGTLNAVLQGQFLDTHELLNASYEDRILLTRKAIDASGKDWNSMGRAERQMVANAAGFSDMAEAAKFMTTSVSDLESSMNSAGEASGSIKEIEDRASAAQSVTDKWSQAMESLAIAAGPIVTVLSAVADKLAVLMDSEWGAWILGIVAAMVLLFYAMRAQAAVSGALATADALGGKWAYFKAKATNKLADAQKKQGKIQKDNTKGGSGFLKFLGSLARIASKNIGGLLALGATFMMIGAGVAIAAFGVAQLVLAFAGLNGPQIIGAVIAIGLFAAMMVALVSIMVGLIMSGAFPLAAAGIWALAGAALAGGIAVLTMAFGFTLVVDAVIKLIPHLSSLAIGLYILAPAIASVALSLVMIGPAGVLAFIGFVAIAYGLVILAAGLTAFALAAFLPMIVFGAFVVVMLALGVAMLMIGKNSSAFVGLLGQIDNMATGSISKVNDLAAAIESVGDSLSNISMPHAIVLTMLLQEIGYVAEQAPKVTPPVVSNIEKLVGAAAEYSEIKWSFFGLAGVMLDPFINMLKAAGGGGATGGGGAGGAGGAGGTGGPGGAASGGGGAATSVVLELDGVVLGRTVEAILNKRNRLRTAVE